MKKLRRRLILIFFFFVLFSSAASIMIFLMIQNNIFFSRTDFHYLVFGLALKDFILLLCALFIGVVMIFVFSKRTANPIAALSKAATEIASGNLDVHVEESDRKDEIGELERQFNLMIRELQSNEYLKKDFISNVSHEFKTPLAIIGGYADLLTEDPVSEKERKEYAALILTESKRLSKLTSNILQLSKLNQDEVRPKCRGFSLDEQIRQNILLLEPKWSAKNLNFQLDLPAAACTGDADLLSEVWMNLIDNAIKFSPRGSTISIQLKPYAASEYQICIKDQGIGMDEHTAKRIFEQFYQGDTSHKQEGNGLGLAITAKILELHHGKISVRSEPEKGSEFTVTLPRPARKTPPHKTTENFYR